MIGMLGSVAALRRGRAAFAVGLLCVLAGWMAGTDTTAHAIARHFPIEDLIETAHRVVHGKVTSMQSSYNADRSQIWTAWGLDVSELLKGEVEPKGADGARVYLAHTRGGTVGNVTVKSSGEPTLSIGGEYLLFLWKDAQGYWNVVGQTQGVLTVLRPEGAAARARNNYRGAKVVEVDGVKLVEKVGAIDGELAALTKQVKDAVRAAAGPSAPEGGGAPGDSVVPVPPGQSVPEPGSPVAPVSGGAAPIVPSQGAAE